MANELNNKHIVLGVCGGIAAYKSAEIIRQLRKQGAFVRVVMTENATHFVGPVTFKALSGGTVCESLFEKSVDASIKHIDWAEEADVAVIAPATANMLAKLANGIADDALSTLMMAVTSPKIVCPSMNTHMYENRATQRNLDILRSDGYQVLEPEIGELACGTFGRGRLPEPGFIVDRIVSRLSPKDFSDAKVLVTAGATQEPIDPVRFISNPSSGKMGFALAQAAEYRGAEVILITGPSHLSDPFNVEVIRVRTAQEMAQAVFSSIEEADVIIKSAAVSDYKPKSMEPHKIKKEKDEIILELEKTTDILKEVGQRKKKKQILVGFAAETRELEKNAGKKLSEKNLDLIVGNIVGKEGSGFGSDKNIITFFYPSKTAESLPLMEKSLVAHEILDRIRVIMDQKYSRYKKSNEN